MQLCLDRIHIVGIVDLVVFLIIDDQQGIRDLLHQSLVQSSADVRDQTAAWNLGHQGIAQQRQAVFSVTMVAQTQTGPK
jgi:hypothetical protein